MNHALDQISSNQSDITTANFRCRFSFKSDRDLANSCAEISPPNDRGGISTHQVTSYARKRAITMIS